MTAIEQFFAQAYKDPTIERKLNAALEGTQGKESARVICDVAKVYGFYLNMDETLAAVSALTEGNRNNGELSDTELEGISGGRFMARIMSPRGHRL